jgi:predicted lipoprotein
MGIVSNQTNGEEEDLKLDMSPIVKAKMNKAISVLNFLTFSNQINFRL